MKKQETSKIHEELIHLVLGELLFVEDIDRLGFSPGDRIDPIIMAQTLEDFVILLRDCFFVVDKSIFVFHKYHLV